MRSSQTVVVALALLVTGGSSFQTHGRRVRAAWYMTIVFELRYNPETSKPQLVFGSLRLGGSHLGR